MLSKLATHCLGQLQHFRVLYFCEEGSVATKPSFTSKVLVVSNTQNTGPLLIFGLQEMQLNIIVEPMLTNVIQRWSDEIPDLVVIDAKVPEAQTIDLIKSLREETTIPILLLTRFSTEDYLLEAYAAGVDECILKPISPSLFYAKAKVWLRRSRSVPADTLAPLRAGRLCLLPSDRTIILDNYDPIRLTNLELRLLYCLMGQPGQTLTIEELNRRVWGYSHETDNTMLKNVIYRLRRKLEADLTNPKIIQTVTGVGYKLVVE